VRIQYNPKYCIRRQIGAFRIQDKVTDAEVAAALAALDRAGFTLEDIQCVLGMVMANWGAEEHQIVAGFAHGIDLDAISLLEFEDYAYEVRQAMAGEPDRWELDVSPKEILQLERPDSFEPQEDEEESE
jgi:hypothetical protein